MKTIAATANDFADLRTTDRGNCIYVDKTDFFHRLVTASGKKLFFVVAAQSAERDETWGGRTVRGCGGGAPVGNGGSVSENQG